MADLSYTDGSMKYGFDVYSSGLLFLEPMHLFYQSRDA